MEDLVLVFAILLEMVGVIAGVGFGYWLGRKDKILGAL